MHVPTIFRFPIRAVGTKAAVKSIGIIVDRAQKGPVRVTSAENNVLISRIKG
jgi:hypothetical protein